MVRLKLNEYLISNKITKYYLSKHSGIQYNIVTKYCKNKVVRYDSALLDKICKTLNCQINDIIEYIPDKK